MALILFGTAAVALGMVVGRWWLLTLPAAMAAGASLLLLMPGTRIDRDNPLPFLLLLLEVALILGILARRWRLLHTPPE